MAVTESPPKFRNLSAVKIPEHFFIPEQNSEWVTVIPFGTPVDPDVNMIYAMSAGDTGGDLTSTSPQLYACERNSSSI
jgi:hypothetical protein